MRRASLAAPLLLIGIGGLFLARNVFPEVPLLDYLAKYWPLLLILWGVLRLAEILFWAATSRPLPPAGVSGGEWVLVVFLCIFGFSLHAARGFSNWLPRNRLELGGLDMFGESFEYPLNGEKPASATPRVVLESFRGNAHITGGDVMSVKVTGRKTVRSMDQNAADATDRESPFELAGDPNRVVIRTNQDRTNAVLGRPSRITAELEITVPKGASIEAHGRNGDFDISGINGDVDITSDNAGVRMENVAGQVRLDLRRSDIVRAVNLKSGMDLKGSGSDIDLENIGGTVIINGGYRGMVRFHNLSGPLHFNGPQGEFSAERIPGEVRMPLGEFTAENLVGPVSLHSTARDVQISGITNSLEMNIGRGDIDLRPGSLPLAKMQVRLRAGDIELALPEGAKFDLNATTRRGEANNDFGAPLHQESNRVGATVRGSNGGPQVDLETQRGRISVRKATPDDAAPAVSKAPVVPPIPGTPATPSIPGVPRAPLPLKSLNPIQQ
jgi:DUF4097 and DUF4098 domain-containing protein YvlB